MEVWQEAGSSEKFQFEIIRIIFAKHPMLLRFLFKQERPELRHPPDELIFEARGFASGELVLLKLAIDIWSGCTSFTSVNEIVSTLDSDNFSNVILALIKLRGERPEFLDYIEF